MTNQQAEKILKEAIEQGSSFILYDIKIYFDIGRISLRLNNSGGAAGYTETMTLHWREYFLSHEFCKKYFGEEVVDDSGWSEKKDKEYKDQLTKSQKRTMLLRDWYPYERAWVYHGEKLFLCADLKEVAEYLEESKPS